MSSSVLYMSMSLDGYIAGPNDEPGNPGGDGFGRLHEWFVTADGEFFRPSGSAGELFDEKPASSVVSGRPAARGWFRRCLLMARARSIRGAVPGHIGTDTPSFSRSGARIGPKVPPDGAQANATTEDSAVTGL
jgi:hypothetical protein